jgi:hypothetical protein
MKKIASLLIISLCLLSCIDVRFVEPQPSNTSMLKSFPKVLQGNFLIESDTPNEIDTITITENYFTDLYLRRAGSSENKERRKIFLSDSLVIKPVNKDYILSFREKQYWYVVLIKVVDKSNMLVMWIDGDNENSIRQLTTYTEVKTILDESNEIKAYRVTPTKSSFKKLVKDGAIFTRLYKLKKLDD